jgi:hypothetical protein
MSVSRFRVVGEYVFWIEGLGFSVKGRVSQDLDPATKDLEYMWEISHYHKPAHGAADVHIPSKSRAASREEAEKLLLAYAESLTTLGVKVNTAY